MKLWSIDNTLDEKVELFTVGKDREYDIVLAPYDIEASIAHATMLEKVGLLSTEELEGLVEELKILLQRCSEGIFVIEDGVEDVHSQLEKYLTEKLGIAGKKIHMGRSRNDQVLTALTLYYKDVLNKIKDKTYQMANTFGKLADRYKDDLMPGYTHSQVGMVSSFGLWFGSFAEGLIQDGNLINHVLSSVDQNPLGTSAGYGNSFPLDRTATTEFLGFENMSYNPIYAQRTRGKHELLICQSLSSLAYTLNIFASDVCLFSSANYRFIKLPASMTTGSSIMPHKKNPDVFELVRAKCNQIASTPNQISMLMQNLMSGYHRDMQSIKEVVFPTFDMILDVLDILNMSIGDIKVQKNIIGDEKYDNLFTVEKVNEYVLGGVPFRDAYLKVSKEVKNGTFERTGEVKHTHEGSIGNLCLDKILAKRVD